MTISTFMKLFLYINIDVHAGREWNNLPLSIRHLVLDNLPLSILLLHGTSTICVLVADSLSRGRE